jgi:uncharacterized protein YecE (DUF72 family)
MHFGRVPSLVGIDFALPEPCLAWDEGPRGRSEALLLRLGAPAWSRPGWVGKLYPRRTKQAEFLTRYAEHFGAIELNSTFYAVPAAERIAAWRASVDPTFRFCAKLPRTLTHARALAPDGRELERTRRMLEGFGPALGPVLAQLPEHVERGELERVLALLASLPPRVHVALELRHPSWFVDRQVEPVARAAFAERRVSLVVTDVAGRRDACHGTLTVPWLFVRFVGDALAPSDRARLEAWAHRLAELQRRGLRAAYFFVHQPDDVLAPETAALAGELFERELGVAVRRPVLATTTSQLELV